MRKVPRHTRPISLAVVLILVACSAPLAGELEPYLSRVTNGKAATGEQTISHLFVWDETLAAQSRARVMIHRVEGIEWETIRHEIERVSPTCKWEGSAGVLAQAVVDFGDLPAVAELPEIIYVCRPPRPIPCTVESEGLSGMEVPSFASLGYLGQGARVAILDLGFAGHQYLIGTELPEDVHVKSFFRSASGDGDINGDGENHGTACAEIVYDIAPGAEIYLVNAESPVEMNAAIDWIIKENIAVISHSIGWFFGSLDGVGPINDIARKAVESGIVWVNASGNEADRHTWAYAVDADNDDFLEIALDDELLDFTNIAEGDSLEVALLWDEWPLISNLDLAVEFVDSEDRLLATSEDEFGNYPYAFRYLHWKSPDGRPIAIRIRRVRGTTEGQVIHLFRLGNGVVMEEHAKADRSLLVPADSRFVIAVGATNWETDSLEVYSSRGSIRNDPIKPELCAPVGVSTRTYGDEGFHGTSAAAPHVAGAATLLASTGLRGGYHDIFWTRDDIELLLEAHAKPAPYIQPLAWGIVRMPVEMPVAKGAGPLLLGNPTRGSSHWTANCETVEIIDTHGRIVALCSAGAWDGRDMRGRDAPAGIYWVRCSKAGEASRLVWLGR